MRLPLTNTVISVAAAKCLATMISQIQASSFVPRVLTTYDDRHNKMLRERAMECLLQVTLWPTTVHQVVSRRQLNPRCAADLARVADISIATAL